MKTRILVIGAAGQIGTDLTLFLRLKHGTDSVVASDIKALVGEISQGPKEFHDCLDIKRTAEIVKKHQIKTIYHLASLLSATSEKYPQKAFEVNLIGLYNTLEVAREYKCSIFVPSTIGVFGDSSPKKKTPQDTIIRPKTMYGITKFSGELLCDYYHLKYQLDVRGLRYPGIISHLTVPSGGTTDFAVDIFTHAIKYRTYTSYIKAGTFLDMIYMPDAVRAAIELMETEDCKLKHRNAFNITAMSLDVEMIYNEIRKHLPDFKLSYQIDSLRQSIAESWPDNIDDSEAQRQWGWQPQYDLKSMTEDMIKNISKDIS